ncbi:MAG: MBL fold metallo-hydrolase [Halobacteriota archaeon]
MATLRLLRHATVLLEVGESTFLVDPMFGSPGDIPPIENTPNDRPNPLVSLPDVPIDYDAVVITHRHVDHFDDAAIERLPRDVPILCQPAEADAFSEDGFTDVRPIEDDATFGTVQITRTPARHGYGELAERMGPVSGFVFEADRTVYLAGDTVWYDGVARTIDRHDPDAIVVNAGAARFNEGRPITMDRTDVDAVCEYADGTVIAVHMDAINHCLLRREELRDAVSDVCVPEDGDTIEV